MIQGCIKKPKQIKLTVDTFAESLYFGFKHEGCINNSGPWFNYTLVKATEFLDVEGRTSSRGAAALAPVQNHKPVRKPSA